MLLIVALVGLFLGSCGVALGSLEGVTTETAWEARSALLLKVSAVVAIMATLPLPIFLDSADHVDQEISHPPFETPRPGMGLRLLAAALALALVRVVRQVDDAV